MLPFWMAYFTHPTFYWGLFVPASLTLLSCSAGLVADRLGLE